MLYNKSKHQAPVVQTMDSAILGGAGGGGGVYMAYMAYMGYIGMCRCEGYGFQAVYSSIGYINQSVWVYNRV